MEISVEQIKALREETGVSIGKCKEVLTEANGDMDKARELLRDISAKAAAKKSDREIGAGVVQAYIHSNNSIGVLIKLACETDYVARNEDFIHLAGDIAMHIAAMGTETTEELLEQPFVKNPDVTIGKLIEEAVLKIGERIEVAEFVRFAV
ncbi:translation elongation factor Ts [Patescibacteria group bacterium]|nr:translation elongation factor Ts [Patescibacteria group bacterium]